MTKSTTKIVRSFELPFRIIRNLRDNGLVRTCRIYQERFVEVYRERRWGVCTTGSVTSEIHENDQALHCYEVANYVSLDSMFTAIGVVPDQDVFLDYGCGKGRAVVAAATRPFRRVLGVELSPDLASIATDNIRRAEKYFQSPDVQIIVENAMEYVVPLDVNVIFMFNPFSDYVMAAVLQKISDSLAAAPRTIRICYMHPLDEENALADCDWIHFDRNLSTGTWDKVRFGVYTAEPVRQPISN
jgi:SAM-dependent methyltransferase